MAKVRLLDPHDSKRRLDRYELIGELASGGMATVFLGRLGGVGGFQRFVAIKRLHPHLASEEEFIEMFLDEARLAAGIHHPHVVPILEVGESDSGYYLVMEYVEGDTLARLMARALARAQPIPRPVLIRIVLDALAGLHAAHELIDGDGNPVQLVHRDVSPQNILVGVDGSSRITDFGVAHAASRLQNTRADRLKGKLAYMSPEQARSGEVDRRADVFAMGIILWEVLAAKRLFKGESEAITLQRVTVEPIPRLSAVLPSVHPALDQVCAHALERDRDRRYRSAADMAEALERAAREAASTSATDLGVASPREVAAYVQGALGEDIAAQRESVRAWLAHSEPSLPKLTGAKPAEVGGKLGDAPNPQGKPPGYDVTLTMPLDREAAAAAARLGYGPRSPRPAQAPNAAETLRARTATLQEGSSSRPRIIPEAAIPTLGGLRPNERKDDALTPLPASSPLSPAAREPSGPTRSATVGSTPNVREALGIPASTPMLTIDGALASEAPVEPRDDDEDEHETLLMDRDAAVAELTRRKSAPTPPPASGSPPMAPSASRPAPRPAVPTPVPAGHDGGAWKPPSIPPADPGHGAGQAFQPGQARAPSQPPTYGGPFPEDGTPSKSIESFMVPARPPPSRTPQLVALALALVIGLAGPLAWWRLHADATTPEPGASTIPSSSATSLTTAAPRPPALTTGETTQPAPSTTTVTAPHTAEATPVSALPPATPPPTEPTPPRLKGKLPKPKGPASAAPVEPPVTAQPPPPPPPPDLPKPPPPDLPPPDDMTNPYRKP